MLHEIMDKDFKSVNRISRTGFKWRRKGKPEWRSMEKFELLKQIKSPYKFQGIIKYFERRWTNVLA